jgi:hypothetical protein
MQAWGVLEQRTGNAALARELFKAALKVDPKNESTWSTWIKMEEDLGRLEAANELRIRRSEQQWEFVIPASFSTRPAGAADLAGNVLDGSSSASGAAAGLVKSLLGTLNRFFSARGAAVPGGAAAAGGSISSSSSSSGPRQQQLMRELLPSDFRADLTLEDIISEASALGVGSGNGSSSSSSSGGGGAAWRAGSSPGLDSTSDSSSGSSGSNGSSSAHEPGVQHADSEPGAAAAGAAPAAAGSAGSSTGSWDSSVGSSRSRELFRRQRQQQRSELQMGLQHPPTRPARNGQQQS